jgi:hypothetical protein
MGTDADGSERMQSTAKAIAAQPAASEEDRRDPQTAANNGEREIKTPSLSAILQSSRPFASVRPPCWQWAEKIF